MMEETPFAERNGKLYVKLEAFMHPLCAFADGIPVCTFEGDSSIYTDAQTALDWCQGEARCSASPKKHLENAKTLREVIRRFDEGDVVLRDPA